MSSEQNPNNYPGATITIVGVAGGSPETKTFDGGGSQAQLSIAVGKGYKDKTSGEWKDTGTDWYTLTAQTDYADANWPDVKSGDKVRVDDARIEFKAYNKKDGTAGVEASLRFGTLVIVEAKASRSGGTEKAPW